jgi:hypothetical protein
MYLLFYCCLFKIVFLYLHVFGVYVVYVVSCVEISLLSAIGHYGCLLYMLCLVWRYLFFLLLDIMVVSVLSTLRQITTGLHFT